jgi:hypothetical protein
LKYSAQRNIKMAADHEDGDVSELLDYEEEEAEAPNAGTVAVKDTKKDVKGAYVSIHSSGFRDFLLKPELLRAILDCGFEHPSEGIITRSLSCCFEVLFWFIIGIVSR